MEPDAAVVNESGRRRRSKNPIAELTATEREELTNGLVARGLRFVQLDDDQLRFWARHYGMVATR